MRKAVVDVFELSDLDTGQRAAKRAGWTHIAQGMLMKDGNSAGKLTKEDIETLVRVYEEFRPDSWKDKSECMVLAVKSVGFEVED